MKHILPILALVCLSITSVYAQFPNLESFYPYHKGDTLLFADLYSNDHYSLWFTNDSTGAAQERFMYYEVKFYRQNDTSSSGGIFLLDSSLNMMRQDGKATYFKFREQVGASWRLYNNDSLRWVRFKRYTDTVILGTATRANVYEVYRVDTAKVELGTIETLVVAAGFGVVSDSLSSEFNRMVLVGGVIGGKRYGTMIPAGVQEDTKTASTLRALPNPASATVTILTGSTGRPIPVYLYNGIGQIVQQTICNDRGEALFDVSVLPAGNYRAVVRYADKKTQSAAVTVVK